MSGTALAFYFTLCFIIGLSSSLDVRTVVNENMEIDKPLKYRWNYLCIHPWEYNKGNVIDLEPGHNNYLVSFGPNITGRRVLEVECSGTLMTRKYIFTAAHCFYKPEGGKKDLSSLWVVAGSKYMYSYDYYRQYRRFGEAWIHSKYKPMSFINDLAIGEIAGEGFALNEHVHIIHSYLPYSIYENVMSYNGKMCVSLGFWQRSGMWRIDGECLRIVHPSSCNFSSGVKGAMCVGYRRSLFREQGSPLVCYDGYLNGWSVVTGILLTTASDRHRGGHWAALYLRIKDYWDDQTVKLSSAPE